MSHAKTVLKIREDSISSENDPKDNPVVRDCKKKNVGWIDADIDFALSKPQGQGQAQAAAQTSSNSTTNTNTLSSNPLQPSPSYPPQLQILGTNSFFDNNQFSPGEVLNYGKQTATLVSVSATLYDANNRVIGVGHTYTTPSDIMPGKKAPFEIVVFRDNIEGGDFRNIHNMNLQVG